MNVVKPWRKLAILGAVGVLAAVTVGCGGDDESAEDTTTASPTTAQAATTTEPATPDTTGAATTDSAAPGTSAAPATAASTSGPTIGPDGRLVPGTCPAGTPNVDPDLGVTADTINIAWVSVDFTTLKAIGFAVSDTDLGAAMIPMVDALNAAGGVCGRTIDYDPIQFDVLKNEGGAACLKVTEDRRNALVLGQGGFLDAPCVAKDGTLIVTQQDFSESDIADAGGPDQIIFSVPPSNEQAYKTSTELFLPDLEGKKVGVWYGSISPAQGDAVEADVLPMLDAAGIDYTAYRTDFQGPNEPEGQAILTTAATDFVSKQVDVVLNFTQNTNHTGIQAEMAAQGLTPTWLSANIGANTANELFAKAFAVESIANGERIASYTMPPTDVGDEAWAKSCNDDMQALGGPVREPGTFEFAALANTCAQFDLLVALLTEVGPEVTQGKLISALEAMPAFSMQNTLTPKSWGAGNRFATHDMTDLLYDGATNTYAITGDLIPIK
jgi:hypothetical protein